MKGENHNAEDRQHPQDRPHPQDQALDELLGRARLPILHAGFASRVLHSIVCEESTTPVQYETTAAKPRRPLASWTARLALVAALFVTCAGALFFNQPQRGTESRTPLDETVLIQALQSNPLTADDLALVTKLGEVLEAELSAHNSLWPDYE